MKKVFELLGRAVTFKGKRDSIKEGFSPYPDNAINHIYNLLFCDKLDLFRKDSDAFEGVWAILLAHEPYIAAVKNIAEDEAQESRLRVLAYNRLRELKQPVPERQLLGVVIEVGLLEGLDTLAVYPDGRVRYINHQAKLAVCEPVPSTWLPKVRKLMTASQAAVDVIGPWDKPRVAPPTAGMIRMSFLVSDGLYFGQGPMDVMDKDPMAQPIIVASLELLKMVSAIDRKAD